MNIPRLFTPVERRIVQEAQKGGAAVAPISAAVDGSAGVRPADVFDDPCQSRCRSIRSVSGYNLCVQLCRNPAFR